MLAKYVGGKPLHKENPVDGIHSSVHFLVVVREGFCMFGKKSSGVVSSSDIQICNVNK